MLRAEIRVLVPHAEAISLQLTTWKPGERLGLTSLQSSGGNSPAATSGCEARHFRGVSRPVCGPLLRGPSKEHAPLTQCSGWMSTSLLPACDLCQPFLSLTYLMLSKMFCFFLFFSTEKSVVTGQKKLRKWEAPI